MKNIYSLILIFLFFNGYSTAQSNLQFIGVCEGYMECTDQFCNEIELENLSLFASTDCSQGTFLIYSYTIDLLSDGFIEEVGSGNLGEYNFPVGDHTIVLTVEDQCGNVISCSREIKIEDCTPPFTNCGFFHIFLEENNPEAIIPIANVTAFSSDGCTPSFELTPSFSPDSMVSFLQFDCFNLPTTNSIPVYLKDNAGNEFTCSVTITVHATIEFCNTIEFEHTPICIHTAEGDTIANVQVNGTALLSDVNSGCHIFNPQEGFLNFKPDKNTFIENGVDLLDYILMNRHYQGIEKLDDIYKTVAADLNTSLGNISPMDLSRMNHFLLKRTDVFGTTPSWKFIPTDITFNNPNYVSSYVPAILASTVSTFPLEFVGIKTGDVNYSADPTEQTLGFKEPIVSTLPLCADDQQVSAGEDFYIHLTAQDFDDIRGMQFSIQFENSKLYFNQIIGNSLTNFSSFNYHQINNGEDISFLWIDTEGESVPILAGDTLMRIQFTALSDIQLSEVFSIDNSILEMEGYNEVGRFDMNFQFCNMVAIEEASQFSFLLKNAPNPFTEFCEIQFQLAESEEVTLAVYDIAGRMVKSTTAFFQKGIQSFFIKKENLNGEGIYFYEVKTVENIGVGKMILN